jgi:uncharacterized protein YeaO (DUF488 family)
MTIWYSLASGLRTGIMRMNYDRGSTVNYQVKRIYNEPSASDGYRVLVDRLWPRGVSKEQAMLDDWLKEVAPSAELRTWFGHEPERFEEFKVRYETELDSNPAVKRLQALVRDHKTITLLYAAKDPVVNHAQVLLGYLQKHATKA